MFKNKINGAYPAKKEVVYLHRCFLNRFGYGDVCSFAYPSYWWFREAEFGEGNYPIATGEFI